MGLLFRLIAHLLVTLARFIRPGGVRAVAAESLAIKHQLLVMKRAQRRGPKLIAWDRLILGFCTLLVSRKRWRNMAVVVKTSTLLRLHRALVKRKYRLLYSPRHCGRPGPKGPLQKADRRGGRDEAAQPALRLPQDCRANVSAFGIDIKKDVVRRSFCSTATGSWW
jgi:hypothetical protein